MFFPSGRTKLFLVVAAGAVIASGILWSALNRNTGRQTSKKSNQNTDVTRQQYADLYQAAWRQDTGLGNVLMTATLFTPTLVDLLGRDAGKSEAENQLYRAVNAAADTQIPVYLTIDSVARAQSDDNIKDSLTLSADSKSFSMASWQPMIMPSRIVNTDAQAYSQSGVAVFSANQAVDWSNLKNLKLVSRDLGGVVTRSFVWVAPGLLLKTPE